MEVLLLVADTLPSPLRPPSMLPERLSRVSRIPLLRRSLSVGGLQVWATRYMWGLGHSRQGVDECHGSLPHHPVMAMGGRMGEVLTLSTHKARKINLIVEKLSYSLLVQDWRWDQGKAGICAIKVKMAEGEVLDQRGLSL